jgi:trans-2,3-dihydro-3-hydroxyanthranilate isomerase
MQRTSSVELPLDVDWDTRSGELHRYFVVDVFTERPLEGNQLGVFSDGRNLDVEQMQRLARELNFSETVFLLPPKKEGDVSARIFTPTKELPFAGHPVLGTAVVVGTALGLDLVRLETGLGTIPVELAREHGEVVFGRMEQAIPSWRPYERAAELLAALGVEASLLPIEAYANGPLHVYVALASEEMVAQLRPDVCALAELGGVAANCFAGSGRRWKTRMFAPGLAVAEDPATGSAAGSLAVHLARHGRIAFGAEIEIRQGAEIGRPSLLFARAEGSANHITRVQVAGSAVIVARGEFRLRTAGLADERASEQEPR